MQEYRFTSSPGIPGLYVCPVPESTPVTGMPMPFGFGLPRRPDQYLVFSLTRRSGKWRGRLPA